MTKMMMEQEIISLLGGRAAEELVIKDITTGASNDIERATSMARDMVTKYGMSELLGPIQFGGDNDEVTRMKYSLAEKLPIQEITAKA